MLFRHSWEYLSQKKERKRHEKRESRGDCWQERMNKGLHKYHSWQHPPKESHQKAPVVLFLCINPARNGKKKEEKERNH
jgi:hypothetical protein